MTRGNRRLDSVMRHSNVLKGDEKIKIKPTASLVNLDVHLVVVLESLVELIPVQSLLGATRSSISRIPGIIPLSPQKYMWAPFFIRSKISSAYSSTLS